VIDMNCAFWRWRTSLGWVAEKALPPGVLRHLRRCAGCRAYDAAGRQIMTDLRAEARAGREAPDGLHEGIMAVIRDTAAAPARVPHRTGWPVTAVAAACAVTVILVVAGTFHARKRALPDAIRASGVAFPDVATGIRTAVMESPGQLIAPMERELDYLSQDVERTVGYLLALLTELG